MDLSADDFDWGRRLFIIVAFLFALWFFLNCLVSKIKSGQWQIPRFLTNKFPQLDLLQSNDIYKISIVQRTVLMDGSELLVLDVDGRRILTSKTLPLGLRYIADLD
jgi:hypothetical protein